MAKSVTWFETNQAWNPYWRNIPPNVPTYVQVPITCCSEKPEKYTAPIPGTRESYLHWTDKWYDREIPTLRREELPKIHPSEPCSQPWQFQSGTAAVPKWSKKGKDWPSRPDQYYRRGDTCGETTRARAMYRLSTTESNPNLYPFTNYMTSTYRKPVWSKYGPMLKHEVYGVKGQHNRHGFMGFDDYY
ncbi:uncharacterized protein LOC135489853 [Lineus longissimus]|uniref:uncharacterized protein LOC135489853 n=1 Tax=Lineus longissimus TaxID=88925 RepID=UPI002B4CD262